MASSRTGSSVINLGDEDDEKSELQFQDFSHGDAATLETSGYSTSLLESPNLDNENAGLLSEEKPAPSFWDFRYYQSFFDVDTDQVIQRILWSMIPVRGRSTYLDRVIRPTPDLYGPFWISTTLIFSTAISANIAEYFMTEGRDKNIWHYDFRKVSIASTAIYSYVFLLPLVLWGLMWYRQSSTRYTLTEILCVYGYSLFIYIPISILWVIPVPWFQWMLVIIGASLSGLVLAQTFWPTVRDENKKIAAVAVCLILLFHALLAVGFVTFFFRPAHQVSGVTVAPAVTTVTINSSQAVKFETQKIVSRDTNGANAVIVDEDEEKLENQTKTKLLQKGSKHVSISNELDKNQSRKDMNTISSTAIGGNISLSNVFDHHSPEHSQPSTTGKISVTTIIASE